jgi:uncharacterized protein (TIGR02266 family)
MDPTQSQKKNILLVDDEPDFRDALASAFKRRGYQVMVASTGKEAFEMIQANSIDVVISDIRMPDGNGVELLDRIRKERIDTPIVLLMSGYSDITTDEAHNKGAEAVFSKPFSWKVLEEAIERLLTPLNERWTHLSESVDTELAVELQFNGLNEAIEAKVINIGRGGMFVRLQTGQAPNVDESVAFKVAFDGTAPILTGSGIVRWVRIQNTENSPYGCGIEFTYLSDAGRDQIINFVSSKKPRAYIPNT